MHKPPTRSRAQALIAQLGLNLTPTGEVELTNPMMLGTNVPGCIVAGDTHEMMKQAVVAAGAGKFTPLFCPGSRLTMRVFLLQ